MVYAANATISQTYWNVGKHINTNILENQRAEYGKQIVVAVQRQLTAHFVKNINVNNLRNMLELDDAFTDKQIVATPWRQLSWSNVSIPISTQDELPDSHCLKQKLNTTIEQNNMRLAERSEQSYRGKL